MEAKPDTDTSEPFHQWCIVEIMGHQRYAGMCTEQSIAGQNMLRVDIPATEKTQAMTKYFGGQSIYALTPVDEETVMISLAVYNDNNPPVNEYSARRMLETESLVLDEPVNNDEDEYPL